MRIHPQGANTGESTGALFADDIDRMTGAPCSLAILAVCGAAGGPQRIGDDGAAHLGGALLARGARGVIVSHGELAVGATMQLLTVLLAELDAGRTPAHALLRARQQVASTPERTHPFHFAGIQLVGANVSPWK